MGAVQAKGASPRGERLVPLDATREAWMKAIGTRWSRWMPAALACCLAPFLAPGGAVAAGPTYTMKLGLATINDSQHEWCKIFVAAVEKDSGGRIKGEIYPASQLGSIPREIEGVQFGSIQGYIGPPEFLSGVDPRFAIPSTPGIIDSMEQAGRVVRDPKFKALMMGVGANKGIHGAALFISQPSSVIARAPIKTLADFNGKKLRVLAAEMQQEMLRRLGATPVAMTLADVLPAIQQGTIDGAVAALTVYTTMRYFDAAKYITETGQPFIFSMTFLSKKWFDRLPKDLQQIVTRDADKATEAEIPWEMDFYAKQRKVWTDQAGQFVEFSPQDKAAMTAKIASIGEDMTKSKPALHEAYLAFAAAAKRTK
jgi:TRAP-type transport system periplasmic protein